MQFAFSIGGAICGAAPGLKPHRRLGKNTLNRHLRPAGVADVASRLSPELRMGRMEPTAFVTQPVLPIFLQEQGAVEIDEAGLLR